MKLTPAQLEAMERGLEGVTPGPWRDENMHPRTYGPAWVSSDSVHFIADCGDSAGVCEGGYASLCVDHNVNDANAAHIARCDPQTIAELIRGYRAGAAHEALVAWIESVELRNMGITPKLQEVYRQYCDVLKRKGTNND